MKLTRVLIVGYRSIKTPCDLIVDNRVTVLIGANDHGKSNLLAAILALNDDPTSMFTEEDRHWDLDKQTPPRIEWHFTLTADEKKKLKQEIGYVAPKPAETPPPTDPNGTPPATTQETQPVNLYPVSAQEELVYFREGIQQPVRIAETPFEVAQDKEASLLAHRPKIELFKPADINFLDTVTRANLDEPTYATMKGIFILAGIWEQRDSVFTQTTVTEKQLAEASVRLTKALQEQWGQGEKHEWKLIQENGSISLRINDFVVKTRYIKPSQRSSGFQTYFYLRMSIIAKNYGLPPDQQHIYLFDEPGTYLHPKAQIDLQRSFEKIADEAQLVYTTHSLFLISKNYPQRNRVVQKFLAGTLIDHKPFAENWKSVRNSLGIIMSNNLLIANKSLLVEGRSDVIYITHTIRQMKDLGKVDIDMNDFTVMDAGDSSNYSAMAKLMVNDGREVICLIDSDDGGKKIVERVEKACAPEEGQLNPVKIIQPVEKNRSIEDLFADINILRVAIKRVIEDLIAKKERHPIADLVTNGKLNKKFDTELGKIAPSTKQTLGYVIKTVTATWFEDAEEISKVAIALKYMTLCDSKEMTPAAPTGAAIDLIKKIKETMILKGEKDKEEGIMEEVEEN